MSFVVRTVETASEDVAVVMRGHRVVGCVAVLLLLAAGYIAGAGQSEVADAAMRGDRTALRALLARKADVDLPQVDGATALHWAVYRDDVEAADLLIRAGADAEAVNRAGITPLAMASLYGHAPMIDRLLRAGADPRARGPNGETMIMYAARNGNPAAIGLLIRAGAEVNATENLRGTTALMWAVDQKHPDAVKALIDGGADVGVRSGPAGLPRNYMAMKVLAGNVEAARKRRLEAAAAGRTYQEQLELERKSGIDTGGRGFSPVAAQRGAAPGAAAGPPPAAQDEDVIVAGLVGSGGGGLTALIFAAREGDQKSAQLLIDAGADVNQATEYGWTPLLTATNNRHYRLGAYLIQRGADVNLANKGGWTPLYLATDNRNIEGGDYPVPKPDMDHLAFIRILLENGAAPNARIREDTLSRTIFTMQWLFESGATAFVRAAQSGDTGLLQLLLKHGADPKIPTDYGDTALTAAAGIGWVEGVTYERSAKENLEAVRMLLDLGLDPNAANNDGRTPLMGAALKGRNDVVRLLVDRGALLDTRDKGSRDTDTVVSALAGHTWQAVDYADGLVRVGVQSAVPRPDTAALIRQLMMARGLRVPPPDRTIESVCVVPICDPRP
jgi:ankyrin repeat protein